MDFIQVKQGKKNGFYIIIYNNEKERLKYLFLPEGMLVSFARRIIEEAINDDPNLDSTSIKLSPWFRKDKNKPIERAKLPKGPTSLKGKPFKVTKKIKNLVKILPDSIVDSFTAYIIDEEGNTLFEGFYHVDDIFIAGAVYCIEEWLKNGQIKKEDGSFYYQVIPRLGSDNKNDFEEGLDYSIFNRSKSVENVFRIPKLPDERKRIRFHKLDAPPLPVYQEDNFEKIRIHGRSQKGKGRILIHKEVYDDLVQHIELSSEVENGGYLLGKAFRVNELVDFEYKWVIKVEKVVQAEAAFGSPTLLLFTGDTWSSLRKEITKNYPNKDLVSWFHTHLFSASDDFGLSSFDHDLHRQFFKEPWQVALLLNLNPDGTRELRCFQQGNGEELEECTFEVFVPKLVEDNNLK